VASATLNAQALQSKMDSAWLIMFLSFMLLEK